jgi:hypothetical protein
MINKIMPHWINDTPMTPDMIVKMWKEEGHKKTNNNIPIHPELIYRLSKEWTGWNDWLGLSEEHESYKRNIIQDKIENIAIFKLTRNNKT